MQKDLGKFSKSCVAKEFHIDKVHKDGPYVGPDGQDSSGFGLNIKFSISESTNNMWTDRFTKTVTQEYYIKTGIEVIGTVGGTLGLFVGLSFLDSGSFLVMIIQNGLSKLVGKKRKK